MAISRALSVRAGVGFIGLAIGAAVVMLSLACAERKPQAPRQIVLICIDTLRSDHLSGNGYRRPTTPNLDALVADEGITFENAYASSSWTLPSVMSVLTGLHPPQHGVEDRDTRLSESATTLAESLAADGWMTAAFVTHIYVSSLFGFDRGFADFHELAIDWDFKEGQQLRADELNRRVLPWLEESADSPFFLYLHYFDPHWDYDPPQPYRDRFTDPAYIGPADGTWDHLKHYLRRDRLMPPADLEHTVSLYDGEILWTDHHIGLLFEALKAQGIWEDALIVIFGDHGEEFQEHGSVHHIRTLYDEVLRVPLLVKLPGGRPEGVRAKIGERVRLLDIAPTILDLAQSPALPGMAGSSLVPLLDKPGADRDVFAHTIRHDADKMATITDKLKLIYTYTEGRETVELYDLAGDPHEVNSVGPQMPDVAKTLWGEATGRFAAMREWNLAHLPPAKSVELTPDQKEHLRALGYAE